MDKADYEALQQDYDELMQDHYQLAHAFLKVARYATDYQPPEGYDMALGKALRVSWLKK